MIGFFDFGVVRDNYQRDLSWVLIRFALVIVVKLVQCLWTFSLGL